MSLRIAMISEHASPLATPGGVDSGGQNVYVAQLARQLAVLGHDVDIFTRRDAPNLAAMVELHPGVRVVHVPAGPARHVPKEQLLAFMPAFERWMADFVRQDARGYDLAHANFWMSGLVAVGLKRRLGLPFVVTFHALGKVRRLYQGEADGFPPEREAIEQRVLREAGLVIAECPQEVEDLVGLYGAERGRIRVAPCGFDAGEFWPEPRAEARRRLGLPIDEPIVLQLGRMVPRKGVDDAIRALSRLRHEHEIPARMLVVGGEASSPEPELTPEIGRLQVVASDEGVLEAVTFAGSRPRDALRWYYSAADAFVTTPWYEPFGITPIEAMACGIPVVGARVGGLQHTIVEGETGYLVPARDPGAIAARVADVLRSPERARQMGRAGIARVNTHFTWRGVAERVADVYEEAITGAAGDGVVRRGGTTEDRLIDQHLSGAKAAIEASRKQLGAQVAAFARELAAAFADGKKALVCGNGGSAADAQHFAAELMGRFRQPDRPAMPILALCADTAFLTAWANDVGYGDVFARQVEGLGAAGDVLVAISTSGRSPNVLRALEAGRARGMRCIALLGGDGGAAVELADVSLVVPADDCQHIQEAHIALIHTICDLVERSLARDGAGGPCKSRGRSSGTRTAAEPTLAGAVA